MKNVIISFNPNLASPDATPFPVGVLVIAGDTFVSYKWAVNIESLKLKSLTKRIFSEWPEYLKELVQDDWRIVRERRDAPVDLISYLTDTLSRSSLFISKVEEQ